MKVIVKTWIDGKFVEVASYDIKDVQQIRHHTDGLEIVLKGYIKLYSNQSVIEFLVAEDS